MSRNRITNKPRFPNPRTADIKDSLDKLKGAFEQATKADGTVDLDAVASSVGDDTVAREALRAIQKNDAFERTERRTYTSCGGQRSTRDVTVKPQELQGAEVQSVLGALLAAKMNVDKQDANHDGVINQDEAGTTQPGTLAGDIAGASVGATLEPYEQELWTWSRTINGLKSDIRRRQQFDEIIRETAAKFAESADGCEALVWAYRSVSTTRFSTFSPWHEMHEDLKKPETGFLRFIPFFNRESSPYVDNPEKLSDKEIEKHLGTSDLKAFVQETQANIAARIGGSYESQWLTGKDMEGHKHLDDPDVIGRAPASC